jgi:hypothetical protein
MAKTCFPTVFMVLAVARTCFPVDFMVLAIARTCFPAVFMVLAIVFSSVATGIRLFTGYAEQE